jgi:hypothetical protein
MKKTSLIVAFAAMVPPVSVEANFDAHTVRTEGPTPPNKVDTHHTKLGAMSSRSAYGASAASFSGITSKLISDALAS